MSRKFSWSITLILLALLFHVTLLAGIGAMLRAGRGPIKNHLPTDANRYIILIDTDQYIREFDGNTYHGLPDSHDFSKSKGFFAIFPSLYCSGTKKNDKYYADFCSPWGKQFFDLHRLWRVWGVDLIENNLIGSAPKQVFIGLFTATAAATLAVVLGFIAVWSYWGAVLTTVVAWIAAITTITVAASSNAFANKLASYSPKLETTGSGKIVAHLGASYLYTVWAAAAISISAALLWSFITWHKRRLRNQNTANTRVYVRIPFIGIVRRTTNDLLGKTVAHNTTSYKNLSGGQEMEGLESRNSLQINLIPYSRDPSCAKSRASSRGRAGLNEGGNSLCEKG